MDNGCPSEFFFCVLIAFNKPFGVLSQFTGDGSTNRTLAEFGFMPLAGLTRIRRDYCC
jgi:hypothetical protein